MIADNLGDAAVVVTSTAIKRGQSRSRGRARTAHPGRPPRRDAGRADAAQVDRRGRRHPRQDHDDLDGRRLARRRRDRSDRDQRRHHQQLRLQRPARQPATGWWSRPTRATAASCGSTARSRSSPTSIPSISTIMAASTRSRTPIVEFVENVPFYGAALLCVDHPEVQAIIPRAARPPRDHLRLRRAGRRSRRQCHALPGRQPLRRRRSATAPARCARSRASSCRCRAATMSRTRSPRSASRSSWASPTTTIAQGFAQVRRRQAPLHQGRRGRRRRRSSTITATTRSRSERCSPPRAKARPGRVIAVVQPHRFTRLRDLMDEFQGAFNDADIVYVAPVYAAGEEPIEGVDAEALVEGLKAARPPRASAPSPTGRSGARSCATSPRRGDMVICLGAGDITKWAAGLADGIREREAVPVNAPALDLPARDAARLDRRRRRSPTSSGSSTGGPARMAVRAQPTSTICRDFLAGARSRRAGDGRSASAPT